MLTRIFFDVWDSSTLKKGERPPDYKLPYAEVVLWIAILITLTLGGVVSWFLWNQDGIGFAVSGIICAAFTILSTCVFFWDWKNRPHVVSADDAQLLIIQHLDRGHFWLTPFVPSSGDELIDLAKGQHSTPDRFWLFKLIVPYDIIVSPRGMTVKGAFRLVDLIRRYRVTDRSVRVHYVTNMAHITAIIMYVNKIPKRSLEVQTDSLSRLPRLTERLLDSSRSAGYQRDQLLRALDETNELLRQLLRHMGASADDEMKVVTGDIIDIEPDQ